jgi:hypothetical protein
VALNGKPVSSFVEYVNFTLPHLLCGRNIFVSWAVIMGVLVSALVSAIVKNSVVLAKCSLVFAGKTIKNFKYQNRN